MDTTPSPRLEPTEVATDTFVVHAHVADDAGLMVPVNTMVIRSLRPVVVDTGIAGQRDQFLRDVFSLVEPADIAWVFVSHDDVDHAGNLQALMEAAPRAVLLLGDDGDRIDVGDRTLSVVRPPVFDSPTTRGLFDPTTGVYWAADAFGTPLERPTGNVAELEPDAWHAGMDAFAHYTAPWLAGTHARTFQADIDAVEGLGATVIAGSHTPVIGRHHVHEAISAMRLCADAPPPDAGLIERLRGLLEG